MVQSYNMELESKQTLDCHSDCQFGHACGDCYRFGDQKPTFVKMKEASQCTRIEIPSAATVRFVTPVSDGNVAFVLQVHEGVIASHVESKESK